MRMTQTLLWAACAATFGMNGAVGAELPSDYLALDYVETTGYQYIDTGCLAGPDTIVEGDVMMTGAFVASSQGALFGVKSGTSIFQVNWNSGDADQILVWSKETTSTQVRLNGAAALVGTRQTIRMDASAGTFSFGGLSASGLPGPTPSIATHAIYLGGRNAAGTAECFLCYHMRIYGFKIWTGGKLERDYVPCRTKTGRVAGLYDLVNGTFSPSEGSQPFDAGALPVDDPTLPEDYRRLDYVETSRAQRFDTGYAPGPDTRMDASVMFYGSYDVSRRANIFDARDGKDLFTLNFGENESNILPWFYRTSADGGLNKSVPVLSGSLRKRVSLIVDMTVTPTSGKFALGPTRQNDCQRPAKQFPDTATIHLLARVDPNTKVAEAFGAMLVRIYFWKIYDGRTLKRDYVPCVRRKDGVAGLYDRVKGTFCTSETATPFVAGGNWDGEEWEPATALKVPGSSADRVDYGTANVAPELKSFSSGVWVKNMRSGNQGYESGGEINYNGVLVSQGALGPVDGFVCYVNSKGNRASYELRFQTRSSGRIHELKIDWTGRSLDNTWHLVTVTYDAATNWKRLYVDGKIEAEGEAVDAGGNPTVSDPVGRELFSIGARRNTENGATSVWHGALGRFAEVSLWNRALLPIEVKAQTYGSLSGTERGLIGYWPLSGDRYLSPDCRPGADDPHDMILVGSVELVEDSVTYKKRIGTMLFVR